MSNSTFREETLLSLPSHVSEEEESDTSRSHPSYQYSCEYGSSQLAALVHHDDNSCCIAVWNVLDPAPQSLVNISGEDQNNMSHDIM